jgi:hypothetical protein
MFTCYRSFLALHTRILQDNQTYELHKFQSPHHCQLHMSLSRIPVLLHDVNSRMQSLLFENISDFIHYFDKRIMRTRWHTYGWYIMVNDS